MASAAVETSTASPGAPGEPFPRSVARVVAAAALRADPRVGELACLPGESASDEAFLLVEEEGRLSLRPPGEHDRPGLVADFPPDRMVGTPARQPLARAFGPRIERVLDLTGGLGGDAYRLAAAGYDVSGYERSPVVFALLESGWRFARESGRVPSETAARLRFEHADGCEALAAASGPDLGVYIDPMYPPPRRASAKPRRALQILRALLPPDDDAAGLVAAAREVAARVVVKRPHHAEPLCAEPDFVLASKLVRFDVYVEPANLSARPA